jgi:hypothetical protein
MKSVTKEKLKDIKQRFIDTVVEAAAILDKQPRLLTRNEYIRVAVDTNIKNRLNKEELSIIGGYSLAIAQYFKKTKEEITEEMVIELKTKYVEYIESVGITPSLQVMKSWGFSQSDIYNYFGTTLNLYKECSKDYPEIFDNLINDSIFTEEYTSQLKRDIKKFNRFVITTAVSGKEVDEKSLDAVKTYCKSNNAMLLVMPCEDVASRQSIFKYELDSRLKGAGFVSSDLYLNDNIHLSSIMVSAKQINPLTGLDRLAQAKGSMILSSPKQFLQFVSTSNTKLPHALMTTAAITVSDYSTDMFMSKRTSYIAEFDHVMGAIVVEIEDKDIYHFRQIQFDTKGFFYDLGKKYSKNKVESVSETVCVFGDTHVGSHELGVNQELKNIVKEVKAKEIIVHDLFDNRFNNHHDKGKPVLRANMARKGLTKLMEEGLITAEWINDWCKEVSKITVVKSNHDEALDRYIGEGRWLFDEVNLYDSLPLVRAVMDGEDPLKFLITKMVGLTSENKINWLKRDQDYSIYGIINDAHGDKGANGSKGSKLSLEKSYFKATIGHSHSAGILRNIYQVGTSTKMKLSYNSGPSSWTHTMCIQYPNGTRQLINIIKNKKDKYTYKVN